MPLLAWALIGVVFVGIVLARLDPLGLRGQRWLFALALVGGSVAGPLAALWPSGTASVATSVCLGVSVGLVAGTWRTASRFRPEARWFLLVALILGLMTVLGSGAAGGPGRFMAFLTEVVGLSFQQAETVNFVVRKVVHVLTYGLLAWSASRTAEPGAGLKAGYGWAVPLACLDEFLQAFSGGIRSGSVGDVLLDVLGMTLFLAPQWRAWLVSRRSGPSVSS